MNGRPRQPVLGLADSGVPKRGGAPPAHPAHRFRHGDIEIAGERSGEGDAIVAPHGFPDVEGTFAAQMARSAAR